MTSTYLILIVVTLALGLGTQAYIKSTYSKYSGVQINLRATGAEIARKMLSDNGVSDVEVRSIEGTLSDHYDPRTHVVNLSRDVYEGNNVSAIAVACHECGHAVQHAQGYMPLRIRTALVPVANFGSNTWIILLIIGFALNWLGLIYLALIFFAFGVLFQLVTLPVEFNASKRGLAYIQGGCNCGWVPSENVVHGSKKVLSAAAMTYVAAALVSVLQLLYYMGMANQRN